jgi:hypothetical protein
MSKMYESIEELMQKTLHKSKATLAIARAKGSTVSGLNDELEKLEKLVVDRIGKIKAAVLQGEAVAAGESQRAEEIIGSLRANVTVLEAKVKETEDTVRRNDAASRSMEKSLTDKIVPLEARLKDAEKIVHEKESTIKALEGNLTGKIRDLESQLKNNRNLLASRDAQINELTSQLQALSHGIKEMSSFFRQAEALAVVEAPGASAAPPPETSKGEGEEKAASEPAGPAAASTATDAVQDDVPANFFDRMNRELTRDVGPMAPMIVRDYVLSLGESMGKFPKKRVPELLDLVSKEVPDERRKSIFRKRFDH